MGRPAPDPVEALLFDLGGVLIDVDFGRCFQRWATNAACAADDIASRFTFDRAYENHERGTLDAAGYFESVRGALSLTAGLDALLEGWNDIYVGWNDEVSDLLVEASTRLPLYAFTNSNPSHQAIWSRRFARELEIFQAIFVSSEIGHRKPDGAAFHTVASIMGTPPSRILFFDDSPENVQGALKAGMQAVHVASPETVRAALDGLADPGVIGALHERVGRS